MPSVFVQIVTYNSPPVLESCIQSVLQQRWESIQSLQLSVIDNASREDPLPKIKERFGATVQTVRNPANLGFCGANNQGVSKFLEGDFDFFLMLNPDVRLEPCALELMVRALQQDVRAGSACPKLCRADAALAPERPRTIDAAGMIVTPSLRHLDRGSGAIDNGQYDRGCYVFGGSGACLLLRREFILDTLLDGGAEEESSRKVFPALASPARRAMLLDEAFFAFREDADLAWRAQLLGWRCRYVPEALGYHQRRVIPERRGALAPEINRHGVRNRFLLQCNNWFFPGMARTIPPGILGRNLLVLLAVLLTERGSLGAFREISVVLRRALERRRRLLAGVLAKPGGRENLNRVGRWFSYGNYVENAD